MSSKVERPTLQGQRIKTRKRDEKEKFDPVAFRDSILQSFIEINNSDQPPTVPASDGEQPAPPPPAANANAVPAEVIVGADSSPSDEEEVKNGQEEEEEETVEEPKKVTTDATAEVVKEASSSPDPSPVSQITQEKLDAISKYLDTNPTKLDYRRYGEVLFDIIIAGGILAPGGTILGDADPSKVCRTELCVFCVDPDDINTIRAWGMLLHKLTRRFMYLEKVLDAFFKKIIVFLKGFTPDERIKLAKITAILISSGQVSPQVLKSALQDHFIKDGIAIEFLVCVLQTWLLEKDAQIIWATLKKYGMDVKVMEFLPVSKRNPDYLSTVFLKANLKQLLDLQKAGLGGQIRRELQSLVVELIRDETPVKEIIGLIKESVGKNMVLEHEIAVLVWNSLMVSVEWNKKPELVADQALKHLKGYTSLLAEFCNMPKSELALIIRIQDYCYDNMNFLKVFSKIIVLFYKADVLSEDVIIKWYKQAHTGKGKSIFLEQMKQFVEWLQNAEEESEGDD